MNGKASAFCIFLLLLSALVFQNLTVVRSITEEEETEYYVKSTVTYSSKGSKIWNFTEREEDRTVGLFMTNSWQTGYLVNSTLFIEAIENDTDGNQVAVLQFPEMLLDPGQNISYAVTYRVVSKPRTLDGINETVSESLDEIPGSLKERYLGAEGPWLVNDTELRSLAYNLAGNESNVLTIIKNFVSWIAENINYTETHEVPLYPNETLIEGEGDCDDQAILLVTLSRIVGIPAFIQIGAIYKSGLSWSSTPYWDNHVISVQKRIGWHGWAMVYIPPWGWLPVDLTYVFGGLEGNPLNAITDAAVTWQGTVQYMNISQTDYVASTRETKDFLLANGFYVSLEDEMVEVPRQKNLFGEGAEMLFPVIIILAALLLASSYIITGRLRRKEETPESLIKS